MTLKHLQNLIEENEPDYFWYIFAHRRPDKQFLQFLHKTFNIREDKNFKGAGVILCEIK